MRYQPYAFPFIGRWQPSEDPVLIDDYGFQDIQNLRKDGKRLKGVSGHTKINTSVWNATYKYPENGFHFTKSQPSESHVIVSARDSSGDNPILYQNKTAIPSAGNFSATLHTADTDADLARFSLAPKGNMVCCNGEETLIWGGDELNITSFIVSTAAVTTTITAPKDFSDEVRNTRQTGNEVAQITDGLDAYTVLMLHCEGADASTTFTDSSDSGHTPTAEGDAQIDTAVKKFGSASGKFDGTGDYVTYPDHANWFMSTDPFTVDLWVKFDAVPSANLAFFNNTGDPHAIEFSFVSATSKLRFMSWDGAYDWDFSVDWSPVAETWYHLAVIRGWGGNANRIAICVDGVALTTSDEDAADQWFDVTGVFTIGNGLVGNIDEFRVSKGVARWQANFTPPVRPYRNVGLYWLVGTTRPIQGVKYYVKTPNSIASTMTAKEWNGASWSDLTITDGTKTGTVSLAKTGSVTFDSTVDTSKTTLLQGLSLYWYQFAIDAGEAEIYYCTVDAPIQPIRNIWSTDPSPCMNFNVYHGAAWKDYTLEVNAESSKEYSTSAFAAQVGAQTSAEYIYMGFLEQITAINIKMTVDINAETATATVYYWDGSEWVAVTGLVDGTSVGGNPLSQSGYISWNAPAREEEFTQNMFGLSFPVVIGQTHVAWRNTISGEIIKPGQEDWHGSKEEITSPVYGKKLASFDNTNAYFYKIVWSETLGADVKIDFVSGVPSPYPVPGYKFPLMYVNRLFLFTEGAGLKNTCLYSNYENPDSLNGSDSGYIYFGDNSEIVAAATLYNLYQTVGIEQLIVTKAHETYRIVGGGPSTWEKYQMSENIGCSAPLSMATCDIARTEEGVNRQVVIWQTDSGVVSTDGARIDDISKDIACYWDPNDSRCIPTARLPYSVGGYDPKLRVYRLLISSGTDQATHNVELEYSPKNREWTKLYRANGSGANPLQIAFPVYDTSGKVYSYGATNEGYVYRLENGNTWDSTAITQYVHTKDLMLDEERPLFRHTIIHYLRLIFKDKATGATEDIDIIHYGDQATTTNGTSDQIVPTDIDMADGPHETRGCTLGPFLYHSFKFTAIISTVSNGMELTGLGLYYEPLKTIME